MGPEPNVGIVNEFQKSSSVALHDLLCRAVDVMNASAQKLEGS